MSNEAENYKLSNIGRVSKRYKNVAENKNSIAEM